MNSNRKVAVTMGQAVARMSCLMLLLTLIISNPARSQLYDTVHRPNVTWYELETPHFRILYHDGFEETARKAGRLLEMEYIAVQRITGGELTKFPVVINGYNDLSNGYVTTLHFRMEVEAPPIAGKILNPGTGGHLENLMAHELVHALQFSEKGGPGVISFLYFFSPDLGRSMHGLNPPGIHEGFAVYVESHRVSDSGGRGNFAPFTNQFYSNFNSSSRWSMGQLLNPSGATRPGDRHYIGGYHFTNWLISSFGEAKIQKSLRSFASFPLLGYAPHLWYHTGRSPGKLYRDFHRDYEKGLKTASDKPNEIIYTHIDFPATSGDMVYQPKWINDNEIIYYGSFYNKRPGFWKYDLSTHTNRMFYETRIDESYLYDLSSDKTTLMYSRYSPHLYFDNTYTTDIFKLDITNLRPERITKKQRVRSPSTNDSNSISALKSHLDTHQLVEILDGVPVREFSIYPDNFVQIATASNSNQQKAIIVNRNGIQGIWFVQSGEDFQTVLSGNPHISFREGSIYDLNWSSDGTRLLFGSDMTGVMHIYEFDRERNRVFQLTGGSYNTMEASYSPDNNFIALVIQYENLRKLAVLQRDELLNTEIPQSTWKNHLSQSDFKNRVGDELFDVSKEWRVSKYTNDVRWIKPRMIIPASKLSASDGSRAYGVSLQSSDVLRKNMYGLDLIYGQNKLFYNLIYTYTGFFPGFELKAMHSPYDPGNDPNRPTVTFKGEEREYGISIPVNLNIDHRNSSNYLFFRPEFVKRSSRISLSDPDNPANNQTTDWFNSDRIKLFSSFGFRLKQNLRSVQPVSGSLVFVQTDYDIAVSNNITSRFQGVRYGLYVYSSPLYGSNQSLRIGFQSVRQNRPGYNTLNLVHEAFNRDNYKLNKKDFNIISSRYTIPLSHPDRGGFLIPAYMERFYAVLFTESIFDTSFIKSDTIVGFGVRGRFRIFYNGYFDIGIGYAFQINRSNSETIVIDF